MTRIINAACNALCDGIAAVFKAAEVIFAAPFFLTGKLMGDEPEDDPWAP